MRRGRKLIVFSDLDGTLLDEEDYSFKEALPGLRALKEAGIPLVLCSSKTAAEICVLRRKLRIQDPFIFENGGGVMLPKGAFPFPIKGAKNVGEDLLIPLGTPVSEIHSLLLKYAATLKGTPKTFLDMRPSEIARLTGLTLSEAKRARERHFDLPFVIEDERGGSGALRRRLTIHGISWVEGGKLRHLAKGSDKGKAARLLSGFYRKRFGPLWTVGLGDAPNDLPLLLSVDLPVVVRQKEGANPCLRGLKGARVTRRAGPAGWSEAILEILDSAVPGRS